MSKSKMLYCGYRLNCETCGIKGAAFTADPPNAKYYAKVAFERQKAEVTDVNHKGHNWEYISKIIGATKPEFDKWLKENGQVLNAN